MRVISEANSSFSWVTKTGLAILVCAAAACVLGLIGASAVQNGWFNWIDQINLKGTNADVLFQTITWFGTTEGVALTSAAMLVILLLLRMFQPSMVFTLTVVTSAVANDVLKNWVGRDRPVGALEPGFAFPSGHAFVCTAVFGLFALILATRLNQGWPRNVLKWGMALFLLLIGYSRLYLGVHFNSDVLAGWVLGLVWVAAFVPALTVPSLKYSLNSPIDSPR